jgi:hypothetical protein
MFPTIQGIIGNSLAALPLFLGPRLLTFGSKKSALSE